MSVPPIPFQDENLSKIRREAQQAERELEQANQEVKLANQRAQEISQGWETFFKAAIDDKIRKEFAFATQHLAGDLYHKKRDETLAYLKRAYGEWSDAVQYGEDQVNLVFGPEKSRVLEL